MDNRFKIPGTNIRFGFDFLIGIIPYVGDIASMAVSGLLVSGMARHGASGMLLLKMFWNIILDVAIGSIPILGDIFDLKYRANWRNLQLFEEFYEEGKHKGSGKGAMVLIIFLIVALIIFMLFVIWKLFSWFFASLTSFQL